MPSRPTPFTQAAVARAIAGARKAGFEVAAVEIAPDGSLRLLTDAAPAAPSSPFDEWKASRHAD